MFLGVAGDKGVFGPAKLPSKGIGQRTMGDIHDGLSSTLLVVQVLPERSVPWTKPADVSTTAKDVLAMTLVPDSDSRFTVVFLDGSIATLSEITEEMLQAMLTIDDGKIVKIPGR